LHHDVLGAHGVGKLVDKQITRCFERHGSGLLDWDMRIDRRTSRRVTNPGRRSHATTVRTQGCITEKGGKVGKNPAVASCRQATSENDWNNSPRPPERLTLSGCRLESRAPRNRSLHIRPRRRGARVVDNNINRSWGTETWRGVTRRHPSLARNVEAANGV